MHQVTPLRLALAWTGFGILAFLALTAHVIRALG